MNSNPSLKFPRIAPSGSRIDASTHVEPGTGTTFAIAAGLWAVGALVATVASWGLFLLVPLISLAVNWYLRKKARALIHGSGVRVHARQFPEIHECVETIRERLGIQDEIDVYIVEDNVANAVAVKYGKRNVVLLTDDLIHGCLQSGEPRSLAFVIAHELAHISLGHCGVFRRLVAAQWKKLSRLDEHSADAVALAIVGEGAVALRGILLLTVGYALLPYLDPESIAEQAHEVADDRHSKKAEKNLTHPLLLNRVHRILRGNPTLSVA